MPRWYKTSGKYYRVDDDINPALREETGARLPAQ